jgi:hypothetical protein
MPVSESDFEYCGTFRGKKPRPVGRSPRVVDDRSVSKVGYISGLPVRIVFYQVHCGADGLREGRCSMEDFLKWADRKLDPNCWQTWDDYRKRRR